MRSSIFPLALLTPIFFRSYANSSLNTARSRLRISTATGPDQKEGTRIVPCYKTSGQTLRTAVALSEQNQSR
jgi:hypothetical protein